MNLTGSSDAELLAAGLFAAKANVRFFTYSRRENRFYKEPHKETPLLQQSIEELDLSIKAFNCLKRANVRSLEELTTLSRFDLMKVRNMGIKTIAEVETKLKDKGLSLRSDYE